VVIRWFTIASTLFSVIAMYIVIVNCSSTVRGNHQILYSTNLKFSHRRRNVKVGERRGDPVKAVKFVKVYWHWCSSKRSGALNGILKSTGFLARRQMGGQDFTRFHDPRRGISLAVTRSNLPYGMPHPKRIGVKSCQLQCLREFAQR
jgi:hypothetical protein